MIWSSEEYLTKNNRFKKIITEVVKPRSGSNQRDISKSLSTRNTILDESNLDITNNNFSCNKFIPFYPLRKYINGEI